MTWFLPRQARRAAGSRRCSRVRLHGTYSREQKLAGCLFFPGAGSQTGLGDIVQSLFFSPVKPVGGVILGLGPAFLFPTGTDRLLSARKFGLGPTGVGLMQESPWTFGLLFNHIWSVAGRESRPHVSNTHTRRRMRGRSPLTVKAPTTGKR
jgi:hypothetical protein